MEVREGNSLKDRCKIATGYDGDSFVGIKKDESDIIISFPIGYALPEGDKEVRRDIVRLVSILSKYSNSGIGGLNTDSVENHTMELFPIQAYLNVLRNFMEYGYYSENEVNYKVSKRGKINWSRTIKKRKPIINNNSLIYMDFIVKDSSLNSEGLISLVHEYCVYESFNKIGWLYTDYMPKKPRLSEFNQKLFTSVIYVKLRETFNDNHKMLFNDMLAIINYLGHDSKLNSFRFGTDRFEYIWEKLIDFTYGINNKADYFPRTVWNIKGSTIRQNSALEPDTIMILGDKVYVLDAKYYKYGVTFSPKHLPESSSINKQITYAEFIATQEKFKVIHGQDFKVYNAFIMPFGKNGVGVNNLRNIGEATAQWKNNSMEYERVQGILLDIRTIMFNVVKENDHMIMKLSDAIVEDITHPE